MHRSKAVSLGKLSSWLSLSILLSHPSTAVAGCRACDVYFHCVQTSPGALFCMEGPGACFMSVPCYGGGFRLPDSPAPEQLAPDDGATGGAAAAAADEDLTTWTLYDAVLPFGGARPFAHSGAVAPGAGALALGEDARPAGVGFTGPIADAAFAYGRTYAVSLVDAAGDGFALSRAVEGAGVRLEVRAVAGERPGAVLASELLGERDRLRVTVHVAGRDRVLVLQTGTVSAGSAAAEIARLRQSLVAVGRAVPQRAEPLLRVLAR